MFFFHYHYESVFLDGDMYFHAQDSDFLSHKKRDGDGGFVIPGIKTRVFASIYLYRL